MLESGAVEPSNIPAAWWALMAGTAVIALAHAAAGPDHYLPFIAIGRARGWNLTRAFFITLAAGIAHVLSSVVIGFIGIAAGITLERLEFLEGTRGTVAGWLLVLGGVFYLLWSLRQHSHRHAALDADDPRMRNRSVLFWTLVAIVVLGPCEPLIPLMFVAVQISWWAVAVSSGLFMVLTLLVMEVFVLAGLSGLKLMPVQLTHRAGNVLASLVIIALGAALMLLP